MSKALDEHGQFSGKGIQCVHCGHSISHVVESRSHDGVVLRRRECKSCKKRYSTNELVLGKEGLKHYAFNDKI